MGELEFQNDEGNYATPQNMEDRTLAWQDELEVYCKAGKRFDPGMKNMALLVIDVQEFFMNDRSHAFVPASQAILPNIRQLINKFREIKQPVIFTRHAYLKGEDQGIMGRWWGDNIMDDDPLSQITTELAPLPDEPVIRKTRYSAFMGTELEDMLREKGIDTVLITGVVTHLCCESTAREAFMKDFAVYMTIDGTASYSEELHISSLRALATGFAIPVTTRDIIFRLTENVEGRGIENNGGSNDG